MYLITGASRGIGNYLFNQLTKQNKIVFGTKFNTKADVHNIDYVDIINEEKIDQWLRSLPLKKIILVNCAGVNYNSFAHKSNLWEWQNVININLVGAFKMIHAVLPYMRKECFGRIINLSSVVSQTSVMGTSSYAASKSALTGMIRSIAKENARNGITINNINLGYFNCGMISEVPDEFQKNLKEAIPNGDFGDPKQILNTINYIVENDYLNGTEINLNGGLY